MEKYKTLKKVFFICFSMHIDKQKRILKNLVSNSVKVFINKNIFVPSSSK